MAQGKSPEFKDQYCKTKHNRKDLLQFTVSEVSVHCSREGMAEQCNSHLGTQRKIAYATAFSFSPF
jgi:hypothetical protein